MNPLDWLKAIYGAVGAPYPRASFIFVTAVGAVIFAVIWMIAADQYRQGIKPPTSSGSSTGPATTTPTISGSNSPVITGPATTNGPNSPAVTAPGNSFNYNESVPPEKREPKH